MERLLRFAARALTLLALAVLAGMAAGLGSGLLSRPCDEIAEDAPYDLAVVLSASIYDDGTLDPESRARTDAAIALHEAGTVARLHFTGDGTRDPETSTAESMEAHALAAGVPASLVTEEHASRSTLQNALFSRPATEGAERILLISTGYHLWRGAASMAWAGTPVAGTCASGRFGGTPLYRAWYEGLRWPVNVFRAAVWSGAAALGMEDRLPGDWLA